MPVLPLTWINALFQKFERFYGQDFVRKWAGTDVMAVKQEWAEKLGKFDGETLRQAAEYCGDNIAKPPSLPEFVTICKNMRPAPVHHAFLPEPKFEKTEYGMKMAAELKKLLAKKVVS
jgi:hypothetical protein